MLLNRLTKFFTSLRLTVVLLAFAIVLIWVGTVAQADEGLYQAQTRYFKQWIVVGANMFGHHIPLLWPGGYLIGSMLLINLVAAHIARFQITWKKLGIHLAHGGIILLLVGQLATDMFSRETQLRLSEGQTKSYVESPSNYELIFSASADASHNQEIAIPVRLLAKAGEISNPQLPFSLRVKSCWHNSEPLFRAPMMKNGPPLTTNGVAVNFDFRQLADTKTMDDKNVPTALIEIIGPNGSLGDWVVSDWTADAAMIGAVAKGYEQMGASMAQTIVSHLTQPQAVTMNGKKFNFFIRPERSYLPFSLTLLKATHSVYVGTVSSGEPEGIPKDFRSRVRLDNPQTGEHREVEIFMNNPLRYAGLTFYQYQMDAGDAGDISRLEGRVASSVLQVVHNPSWLTPYIGCILVAFGLVIQFMMHLTKFVSRRKPAAGTATAVGPVVKPLKTARVEKRALQETVHK
jgi:hypothetical protein